MTEDEHYPERGYNTDDVAALRSSEPPKKSFARRHWGKLRSLPSYSSRSSGSRCGHCRARLLLLLRRTGRLRSEVFPEGWLCKTYEGEIAMVNLPGQLANTFQFTVRDDSVAALISKARANGSR